MLNFLSNALKFTPVGGQVKIETIVTETQDIRDLDHDGTYFKKNSFDRNIKRLINDLEMMTSKKCLTPRASDNNTNINKLDMI